MEDIKAGKQASKMSKRDLNSEPQRSKRRNNKRRTSKPQVLSVSSASFINLIVGY